FSFFLLFVYVHFFFISHHPPRSTLFPYTTLFRSISTSTLPSIKLRKCSSKIITSILSFISGRLATKSSQIKQLIRNGRSASLQRSEERFSRNAETDLVCRLLLEKKKKIVRTKLAY